MTPENPTKTEEVVELGKMNCSMPQVPERQLEPGISSNRLMLIRLLEKKWLNGTKLHYYFWTGGAFSAPNNQRDLVRRGFRAWEDLGIGVEFKEVTNILESQIRIGFMKGDGAWSYLGRDILHYPGRYERTMNFGWDISRDPRGVDVAIHEIGHTLGFPHEHQNPFSGIVWDNAAVYKYFGGPPNNWSERTTYYNILRKLEPGSVSGSTWDPDSIMGYEFAGGLIKEPPKYRNGLNPNPGLSQRDINQVKLFYPSLSVDPPAPPDPVEPDPPIVIPKLAPSKSEHLSIKAGDQIDFSIEPDSTDKYTIQTFGISDTLLVLFEDVDGDLKFIAGDDDSGTNNNALIKAGLDEGKKYILKVRLYHENIEGDTTVMMWKS